MANTKKFIETLTEPEKLFPLFMRKKALLYFLLFLTVFYIVMCFFPANFGIEEYRHWRLDLLLSPILVVMYPLYYPHLIIPIFIILVIILTGLLRVFFRISRSRHKILYSVYLIWALYLILAYLGFFLLAVEGVIP